MAIAEEKIPNVLREQRIAFSKEKLKGLLTLMTTKRNQATLNLFFKIKPNLFCPWCILYYLSCNFKQLYKNIDYGTKYSKTFNGGRRVI